jgi:hypothetical protein
MTLLCGQPQRAHSLPFIDFPFRTGGSGAPRGGIRWLYGSLQFYSDMNPIKTAFGQCRRMWAQGQKRAPQRPLG